MLVFSPSLAHGEVDQSKGITSQYRASYIQASSPSYQAVLAHSDHCCALTYKIYVTPITLSAASLDRVNLDPRNGQIIMYCS